jgi:elongation factor P
MVQVNDLKPGQTFGYEKNIFVVIDILHNKTAMRGMIVKTKVRNLRTGVINELSFTGGDKVESVLLEKKKMNYLYNEADFLVFMDNTTYEQVSIPKAKLEWEMKFLVENQEAEITYIDEELIGVALPVKVKLKVAKTEPGVRGDTATRATKDAILETGHVVRVPLFIEEGEVLLVRTDTGDYDSRA